MSDTPAVLKGALTLAAIAAVCTSLVAATHRLTAERIAANEQALLEQSLQPALAGLFYDSNVTESKIQLPPPHGLPGDDPAIVYRVFAEEQPVAALFAVTAPDGYAGPLRVLVGVGVDGVVTGIRILAHRETPGLGDKIEQSRSDWVHQFEGRSLGDPPVSGWAIREDGGEFDQLTGASITPRAVVKAITGTLLYFEANREALFTVPAGAEDETQ